MDSNIFHFSLIIFVYLLMVIKEIPIHLDYQIISGRHLEPRNIEIVNLDIIHCQF
jgi:hypothetical protein